MLKSFFLLAIATAAPLVPQEADVTFRSEVALARVDALVLDRYNRAITGLGREDFVLLEGQKQREIRNFASEEVPVDVLLLLDVSGSMRPHVERLATAASTALRVLGEGDRVGVMVFDKEARMRLPFRENRTEVAQVLEAVLRDEGFNGGTEITGALYGAVRFIERNARREARRAIVILTDDQTGGNRDEAGVGRALAQADVVLSALLAPDAMGTGRLPSGAGNPWPGGSGGGWGGIILGRRGPMGGSRGPVVLGPQMQSAGTAEIARSSGGDSMNVEDANSLETTLARIRQRYALHFHADENAESRSPQVEVLLSDSARRRYPDAEIRFRRINMATGSSDPGPVQTSSSRDHRSLPPTVGPATTESTGSPDNSGLKRRPGVSESSGGRVASVPAQDSAAGPAPAGGRRATPPPQQQDGWRRVEPEPQRGWRKLKPGEQP